jgi:23S rRNA (guanosine2251-2'-O)-methyltransferase
MKKSFPPRDKAPNKARSGFRFKDGGGRDQNREDSPKAPFRGAKRRPFNDSEGERKDRPARRFEEKSSRDQTRDRRGSGTEKNPFQSAKRHPLRSHQPSHGGFRKDERPKRTFENKRPLQPETKPAPQQELQPARGLYIWGVHAVREAWCNPARKCFRLLMTEAVAENFAPALEKANASGLARPDVKIVTRDRIDALLPEDTVHQGLLLDAAPLPEPNIHELLLPENAPDLIVVLDQVTDPHNVGAILRSAAAFGAGAVIVTERNAPQTTGVMAKVASGAVEYAQLIPVTNLARTLEALGEAGYWRVGLAEEGEAALADQRFETGKTVLVLGAEGTGLRRLTREKCDALAKLPTQPPIGSLNVSNAAAIALYEVRRQRAKPQR